MHAYSSKIHVLLIRVSACVHRKVQQKFFRSELHNIAKYKMCKKADSQRLCSLWIIQALSEYLTRMQCSQITIPIGFKYLKRSSAVFDTHSNRQLTDEIDFVVSVDFILVCCLVLNCEAIFKKVTCIKFSPA